MTSPHRAVTGRLAFFAAGAATTAAIAILAGASTEVPGDPVKATIDQEPVLLFDVAGFGIGGPLHSRLAVYTDGVIMVAEAGNPIDDGAACFSYVPPEAVTKLRTDLRAAGAFSMPDSGLFGADLPLTTITVFQPLSGVEGGSRAHTFSYTAALSPQLARIASVVQEFRDTYIPPDACADSGW